MKTNTTVLKKIFFGMSVAACFLLLVFLLPDTLFAQPSLPKEPTQTPIDGGLGILAALGGTYAIKKLRDKD